MVGGVGPTSTGTSPGTRALYRRPGRHPAAHRGLDHRGRVRPSGRPRGRQHRARGARRAAGTSDFLTRRPCRVATEDGRTRQRARSSERRSDRRGARSRGHLGRPGRLLHRLRQDLLHGRGGLDRADLAAPARHGRVRHLPVDDADRLAHQQRPGHGHHPGGLQVHQRGRLQRGRGPARGTACPPHPRPPGLGAVFRPPVAGWPSFRRSGHHDAAPDLGRRRAVLLVLRRLRRHRERPAPVPQASRPRHPVRHPAGATSVVGAAALGFGFAAARLGFSDRGRQHPQRRGP